MVLPLRKETELKIANSNSNWSLWFPLNIPISLNKTMLTINIPLTTLKATQLDSGSRSPIVDIPGHETVQKHYINTENVNELTLNNCEK